MPTSTDTAALAPRHEIAFFNADLPDLNHLLADVRPGIEVILLDPAADGVLRRRCHPGGGNRGLEQRIRRFAGLLLGPDHPHRRRDHAPQLEVGVVLLQHGVLETEQGPGVHLEGEMKVDRPVACLLGVKIDFPELPERIRLDEVTFVVHVEPVVDRMALQIGHETGDIDDGHEGAGYRAPR